MNENIVLIVADTLRAKNLASYGYDKKTAPFLSTKNHVGNYYSNSPWTVPAHATIFTGDLPSEHGTTTEYTYFEEENLLVSRFSQEGYRTVGLTENPLLTQGLGFGEGFDVYGFANTFKKGAKSWNKIWEKDSSYKGRKEKYKDFLRLLAENQDLKSILALLKYLRPLEYEDYNPTHSKGTIDQALEFLDEDGNIFLFLNLMPVHAPYTFNEEQKRKYLREENREEIEKFTQFDSLTDYLNQERDFSDLFDKREKAYNSSISYLDSLLEYFYEKAPENTIFVVVGDHGELIGEYEKNGVRLIDHHFGTFKELIEVPLYIYSKGDDIELQTGESLYDHRSLNDLLLNLASGSLEMESKQKVMSEYFGKVGFNQQRGLETPERFSELFERKSFSLIDKDVKYDLTSDGEYLWSESSMTEKKRLEEVPDYLAEKAEILYSWRLE